MIHDKNELCYLARALTIPPCIHSYDSSKRPKFFTDLDGKALDRLNSYKFKLSDH